MNEVPKPGAEVSESDDLRRAVHLLQIDDNGEPTSAALKSKELSLDVASLCTLEATRKRFPSKAIAILACKAFRELSYFPLHDPQPDNVAHAIVRGKIRDSAARKLAASIKVMIDPIGGN